MQRDYREDGGAGRAGGGDPAGRSGGVGLLRRADREKIELFLGSRSRSAAALAPLPALATVSGSSRLALFAGARAGVARWLEYRMNLFDGVEG